jgi:hypothetical protein
MPIDYTIEHQRRLVTAAATGTLTRDEIFAYQNEVWSRQDVAGYNQILDMSAVTSVDAPSPSGPSMEELAALAASMDDEALPTRFAIVAPGDLAFGLGRMYAVYRGQQPKSAREVGVFRTMDEALAWIEGTMREAPQ